MNNKWFKIILTVFLLFATCTLVACQPDDDDGDPTDNPVPSTYTVTFETNGGSAVNAVTVEEGTKVNLVNYTTSKSNYTFEAWYKDANLTELVTEVTVNKNLTVYAGYSENKFKLSFETNGGSEVAPIEAYRGTILKAPEEPTKAGYVFDGWYKDADFVFRYEFLDNSFMHGNDTTLYAKWIEAKTITIKYVGVGKEDLVLAGIESTEVEELDSELAGYVFEGYYSDDDYETEYTFSIYPTENETVYAKYHALNKNVTLTYVSFENTVATKENLVEQNEAEELTPDYPVNEAKDYYYFDGWYTDAKFSSKFDGIVPQNDTTLYARWIRDGKYVVISFEGSNEEYFIKKGSKVPTEICEEYLTEVTIPNGMIMDGYVTAEGSTFNAENDYVYRDMKLSPNIYSDGLLFEPVYVETLDGEGSIISVVSGYSVKGYDNQKIQDSVVLPDYYQGYKVIEVSANAFDGSSIENIELPMLLETIRESAFLNCYNLTSIEFPKTLKEIGDLAFAECHSLENVTYNGNLDAVGYKVFENSLYLNNLRAKGEGGIYIGLDNEVIYEYNRDMVHRLAPGAKAVFGNKGATIVAGGAFEGIANLGYVSLPDTILTIGKYAFRDCVGLTEVAVNSNVVEIQDGAFYNCSSLTAFVIPTTVTIIGDEVFRASGLVDVTLNQVLYDYGQYTFADCQNLVNVIMFVESNFTTITEGLFSGCTSLEGLICTDYIQTIESYAFENCTSLEAIYLGYTNATIIQTIEENAFIGCDNLKRAYFLRLADTAGNLVEIEENAFPLTKSNGEPSTYRLYVPNANYSNNDFEGTYQEYYISKLPEMYRSYVYPYDTTKPSVKTYITTYQMDPNPAVDVYDLIANGGVYSATDNITAQEDLVLRINSVRYNSTIYLDPVEGTEHVYDMSSGGTYVVSYSIIDEFGNAVASSLTIKVNEKEL